MHTLKQHIFGACRFEYYRDGNLWYSTHVTRLIFPVPIDDIGNATFNHTEKGLLMMRYIRKHLETLKDGNTRIGTNDQEKAS